MVDAVIGDVSALRWHLPVHTPSDQSTEDCVECAAIDSAGRSFRENAMEAAPRIAHVSMTAGGEQSEPEAAPNATFGLSNWEAEGRAAVANALGVSTTGKDEAGEDQA